MRHGYSKLPEYRVWKHIKGRVFNKNDKAYPNYGGRGITMSPGWSEDFTRFYADMGPRPSPKHSIERCDNNGDYTAENCVWATNQEQSRNRRSNKSASINGLTKLVSDWAVEFGIPMSTISCRMKAGMTPEDALLTPVRSMNRRGLRTLTLGSVTRTMSDWSKHLGISVSTIWCRVERGLSDEDALTTKGCRE